MALKSYIKEFKFCSTSLLKSPEGDIKETFFSLTTANNGIPLLGFHYKQSIVENWYHFKIHDVNTSNMNKLPTQSPVARYFPHGLTERDHTYEEWPLYSIEICVGNGFNSLALGISGMSALAATFTFFFMTQGHR